MRTATTLAATSRNRSPLGAGRIALARISLLAMILTGLVSAPVSAHSIDYLAAAISPAASFNGQSGNFTLNAPVTAGTAIQFQLTFSINTQGSTTTYPRTVTFGATTSVKPSGAPNPSVVIASPIANFTSSSSTHSTNVTITAPATEGSYTVKIDPASGTGGQNGLSPGGGIAVNFTVANACAEAQTSLSVSDGCILYRQASTTLSATLTSNSAPLAGQSIDFSVDGNPVGSASTDVNGVAQLAFTSSALAAGDHTVVATFAGDGCAYDGTSDSATLGVEYVFVGYQQPINADGSSQFGGRVIPVKIKIADAYGAPVTDAVAHVFFKFGTAALVGTEAEPVGNTSPDGGNTMRYDAAADQYIFNWDVGSLQNGTYTVYVDLGEGSCGDPHLVTLSLKRKGK